MSDLEGRTREHYEAQSLTPERLEALVSLARGGAVPGEVASGLEHDPDPDLAWERQPRREADARRLRSARTSSWGLGLAATVLLAFGFGLLGQRSQERANRVGVLAAEIALNHHKALALDVETPSYDELRQAMPQLDFTPVAPDSLHGSAYELLGARYCSIGGSIAAQLRLRDASGRRATLYELRAPEIARGIERAETEVDGLRVSLWREGGLLLGLARPVGDPE